MSVPEGLEGLCFACECVSAKREGYSDPWSAIAKNKLLPDGTKEEILNLVAREPKTISQLAEALELSPPSVHAHIGDMVRSELLREAEEWEKSHPTERYYEPNFPVVTAEERAEFASACREMAEQFADLFEKRRARLERAFGKTGLAGRGWEFADLAQYLYATVQRGARTLLEERGALPPRERHANGVAWVFWAEEPEGDK
ncbi:MAG: winged helix-turn-helix domain-containing protein [Acidobacteria bacterium]|nr:winged helix-turn-helix domain-containing protein [Acidobacteriota bacterium]